MRIIAISDLHGYLPELPDGDLLLLGGDLCPDGIKTLNRRELVDARRNPRIQGEWFEDHILPWVGKRECVAVWGNHDYCGLVKTEERFPFLNGNTHVTKSGLKVWGSPMSNLFGSWAFMDTPKNLAPLYESIPEDVDIIISHGPPMMHGDKTVGGENAGNNDLLMAIRRVQPKLVICGHIHEAHGRYLYRGIPIYNVSLVDEFYRDVNPVTVIDLEEG